jgi:hypothetical protein
MKQVTAVLSGFALASLFGGFWVTFWNGLAKIVFG